MVFTRARWMRHRRFVRRRRMFRRWRAYRKNRRFYKPRLPMYRSSFRTGLVRDIITWSKTPTAVNHSFELFWRPLDMPRYQNLKNSFHFCRVVWASVLIRSEPNIASDADDTTPGMIAAALFKSFYDSQAVDSFDEVKAMPGAKVRSQLKPIYLRGKPYAPLKRIMLGVDVLTKATHNLD
ncbi:hypothetical protein Aperf_G00000125541 [Anoplocephala perfoliata]